MVDELILETDHDIKIFSDPLHLRILTILGDYGPQSSADIARKLNDEASRIHYHLKKMESIKIIELDHEERINGIRARFMRVSANSYTISKSKLKGISNDSIMNIQQVLSTEFDSTLNMIINRIKTIQNENKQSETLETLNPLNSELIAIASNFELDAETAKKLHNDLSNIIKQYSQISKLETEKKTTKKNQDNVSNTSNYRLLVAFVKKPEFEK